MPLERLALILFIAGAILWLGTVVMGLVASFPFGLPILGLLFIGIYLIWRVILERMSNAEDDYYDKNVKQ